MFSKIFFLLIITTNAFAYDNSELVTKYILKTYLKDRVSPLIVSEDKAIPFKDVRTYTVVDGGSTSGGWKVWVDAQGNVSEINTKGNIHDFLKSVEIPLGKVKVVNATLDDCKNVSLRLLGYLTPSVKKAECEVKSSKTAVCELSVLDNPALNDKATLSFDIKTGKATLIK